MIDVQRNVFVSWFLTDTTGCWARRVNEWSASIAAFNRRSSERPT